MPQPSVIPTPRTLTADEVVALIFALLGFILGIVVWLRFHEATLASWLLATGVASLVYRFLGGVQGVGFDWGRIKAAGSLAALISVAFMVRPYFQQEIDERWSYFPKNAEGRYEWQWAGEGWLGYVTIEANGRAHLDSMVEYATCNGVPKILTKVRKSGDGKANLDKSRRELEVEIPVTFIQYDEGCKEDHLRETVLKGTLLWHPAYAGPVDYIDKNSGLAGIGDMVLVRDFLSSPHQGLPNGAPPRQGGDQTDQNADGHSASNAH